MPDPAPYFTWADVAAVVKGEKRLKTLLNPSTDTADDHPEFDRIYQIVVDAAEAQFTNAGFKIPLPTPLVDTALRNALIGMFIGTATETDSSSEEWMSKFATSSTNYLERVGQGEVAVKGSALLGGGQEVDGASGRIGFRVPDRFRFDSEDPFSEINEVFPEIGPGPFSRRGGVLG